jgi:hypothetical protein
MLNYVFHIFSFLPQKIIVTFIYHKTAENPSAVSVFLPAGYALSRAKKRHLMPQKGQALEQGDA